MDQSPRSNPPRQSASAESTRDLRIDDLYRLRRVESPRVSPDGKQIVFVLRWIDRDSNGYRTGLHLYDCETERHRPLTSGTHLDHSPRFSPCGRRLCFVSDRSGKPQIYLIELDGGEAVALTSQEFGAGGPSWSADGHTIAFVGAVDESSSMPHTPDGVERARDGQKPREEDNAKLGADDGDKPGAAGASSKASPSEEDPRVIEHLPYRSGTQYVGSKRRHLHLMRVPSADARARALMDPDAQATPGAPVQITSGDAFFDGPRFGPNGQWLFAWVMRRWDENDMHGAGEAVRLALLPRIFDALDAKTGSNAESVPGSGSGSGSGSGLSSGTAEGSDADHLEESEDKGSEACMSLAPIQRLSPDFQRPGQPKPSPCGRYVAWTNTPRDLTFSIGSHLVVADMPEPALPEQDTESVDINLDLAAAPFKPVANTIGFDRVVEDWQWLEGGDTLMLQSPDRGSRRPFLFDLATAIEAGPPVAGLPPLGLEPPSDRSPETDFVRGIGGFEVVSDFVSGAHAAAGILAAALSGSNAPAELVSSRLDASAKPIQRTQVNAALLRHRDPRPIEAYWFEAPDGRRIHGWLIRPRPELATGSLVLEIHGGPHSMWGPGEPSMWLEYQTLATAGHAVFFSNPRGSNGYGRDYRMAIHKNWGFAEEQDFLAGVDLALSETGADPTRVGVTGGSYGGYMTSWLCGRHDRFKAAVSQRGVYDLVAFTGSTDIPKFTEAIFEVTVGDDAATLWKHSPLAYAEGIDIPFLILHAEQDYRAPIIGAEQLFALLKRKGATTVFVRYPREGHELSRSGEPKHRIDRLQRILGWFETYL